MEYKFTDTIAKFRIRWTSFRVLDPRQPFWHFRDMPNLIWYTCTQIQLLDCIYSKMIDSLEISA